MKANKNTKKTTLHTRPLPAHQQMSREEIDADPSRVAWRTPHSFSASRAYAAVQAAHAAR